MILIGIIVVDLFSLTYEWGKTVKLDTTKGDVDKLIKQYVNKQYPNLVFMFHKQLSKKKQKSIAKYKDVTSVYGDLMWEDQPITKKQRYSYLEAKNYCKDLYLANRDDWRVPKYSELLDIVSYKTNKPAVIDQIKYIANDKYWSDTKKINNDRSHWFVRFKYGKTNFADDTNKFYIRCVRDISKIEGEY